MTDVEFEKIALAIKAAYPRSNVMPDKYALKVWYRALEDLNYAVAENAVWEHIGTSDFPPSIAEIRQKCAERITPMITDWGEAWEEVQTAIRRYGSYREIDAVASMSKLTAVAVHRMGFQNLCKSENTVADRAHFQRIYEGMVKEERRQTQLPDFVRASKEQLIEQNSSKVQVITDAEEKTVVDNLRAASDPERVSKLLDGFRKSMIGNFDKKKS